MKALVGAYALAMTFGMAVVTASAEEAAGPQANIVGTVHDADKNAVEGADVVLLSTDGEEVGKASTGTGGTYTLGCVDLGTYHLQLGDGADFKGQKVAAPLGPNGLTVAWAVDSNKPALASATATGGACGATVADAGAAAAAAAAAGGGAGAGSGAALGTAAGAAVGGGALAAGVGMGIASASGAFSSPDSPAE